MTCLFYDFLFGDNGVILFRAYLGRVSNSAERRERGADVLARVVRSSF